MELAKYIIVVWQGREQAVTFPQNLQHVDVFRYMQQQDTGIKAVAAGMFLEDPWWHGGDSVTLDLRSRQEDAVSVRQMLSSKDRRLWDLRVLVWEACEVSRRRTMTPNPPALAIGM